MGLSSVRRLPVERRVSPHRPNRPAMLLKALERKRQVEQAAANQSVQQAAAAVEAQNLATQQAEDAAEGDLRFDLRTASDEKNGARPELSQGLGQAAGAPSAAALLGTATGAEIEEDSDAPESRLTGIGTPQDLIERLATVGYQCLPFLAAQIALLLNAPSGRVRALLLEGPSGCGKSFMAKSLAKITGAELMCLSCYRGMPTQNLIESPSTLALANAMTGRAEGSAEDLMNLGILSRAYLKSREKPVILLIDELDKPDSAIDTFFLGPIQDSRIWLESRAPIDAKVDNLLIIFTKNFNRVIDDALLRRCHPVKMTYLDSTLERKILSPHCEPKLVANLVGIADRMRNSGGSYQFERPPAPEELLAAGHYIQQLVDWGATDLAFVGKSIWAMVAKSEHDRAVLEHMLRYHPDFVDPLIPDSRYVPLDVIYAKLGRLILKDLVTTPEEEDRERKIKEMQERDEF